MEKNNNKRRNWNPRKQNNRSSNNRSSADNSNRNTANGNSNTNSNRNSNKSYNRQTSKRHSGSSNRKNNRNNNRNNNNSRRHNPNNTQNTKRQSYSKQTTFSQHLKVCTLSGTTEIGRNSNFIEYQNDIVVVDFGFSFPGQELLGIDYTIPNFDYLKKNKDRIRAILITHGHLDHTGGLAYVLEALDFPPIYAGRYANALIKERLKEAGLDKKVELVNAHRNSKHNFGSINAQFIGITHSIPNSYSIFLTTKGGNVFITGDYKMDPTPSGEHPTDIAAIKQISPQIDLAMMESTNVERDGFALSDKVVKENLEKLITKHKGRVVVASFASLVSRLHSLVEIAQSTNRKLAVSGRSLITAIRIIRELNYIEFPENLLITEQEVNKYPDNQILFACTGSQGEKYAALNRISRDEHKWFKAKKGDLIIMSSSEVPGNEHQIEKMTDRLIEKEIELIQSNIADVHGSGHGLKGDMKKMFNLINNKHTSFMPVHGSLTKRYKNKLNLVEWGAKEDKVLLTTDGAVWTYYPSKNEWKRTSTIENKAILIDGLGVGDISEVVLRDRETLSQFGMVTIVMNLSAKNKKLIGRPRLVSRGFVYVKNSRELFADIEKIVKDEHAKWHKASSRKKRFEMDDLLKNIERSVKRYIYKKTEREPMVLPVYI